MERLIDLRKIGAIIWKNWLVMKGDKVRLFPMLLFPIVMIVIFGYAMGNTPKNLPSAIVDYDQTSFSHTVVNQISGIDIFSINYVVGTQDEGKKLMDEGKIKVLFILPRGLQEKVDSGQPAQIEIEVDESDASVAQISKSTAQEYVQTLSSTVTKERLAAFPPGQGLHNRR